MSEQRNLVVLGASAAGLQATHYILKHILPGLKAKNDAKYHVYIVAPSAQFFFRVAAPRVAASTTRMPAEKLVFDLHENFKPYSSDDFTFLEAAATGLDTSARTVSYRSSKGATGDERLPYHALIVATGSKTFHQAFSYSTNLQDTLDSITATNKSVDAAKSIVVVGGGPTAVEFAGEVGEHRNGKPGWFSTPPPKAKITLITADKQLLPSIRAATGQKAERALKGVGVNVIYNTRITDTSTTSDGRTIIKLSDNETMEADYYVPAYGVTPNSSWLPKDLLNEKGYLISNDATLRVDNAGPRVYAFGDIASSSRNNMWDIINNMPVLAVNMKRDLMAYNAASPDAPPKGKDRLVNPKAMTGLLAPVGTGGGVGEIMGWGLPSFLVRMMKGRDYMRDMSGVPTANGDSVKSEVKWTAAEISV